MHSHNLLAELIKGILPIEACIETCPKYIISEIKLCSRENKCLCGAVWATCHRTVKAKWLALPEMKIKALHLNSIKHRRHQAICESTSKRIQRHYRWWPEMAAWRRRWRKYNQSNINPSKICGGKLMTVFEEPIPKDAIKCLEISALLNYYIFNYGETKPQYHENLKMKENIWKYLYIRTASRIDGRKRRWHLV